MKDPVLEDMECYYPQKPDKWTKPITGYTIEWYKENGWLDADGNITEKGEREMDLCPDKMNGTETEEHFQKRLRLYKKRVDLCDKWIEDKWGTPGHSGNRNLPFPRKEYEKITLDTIDD